MKTPTLFFSEKRILVQAQQLRRAARRHDVRLFFPVKSFSHPTFLKLVSPFVDGFAVNSAQELKLIRGLGKSVSFYQPGCNTPPARAERYEAVTFDVVPETTTLKTSFLRFRVEEIDRKQKSRFGISLKEIVNLQANRLHFHINDPNISAKKLIQFHRRLSQILKKKKIRLQALNIGGGFQTFSEKDLRNFFAALRKIWGRIDLIAEPGRYYTYGAGFTEATVLSVAHPTQLTTNFSFELHARGSFDLSLFPQMRAKPNRTLKVMGPTAFEEDFRLFPAGQMNQYRVGDSLIIRGISGYSVSWNHSLQGISKAKVHFLK